MSIEGCLKEFVIENFLVGENGGKLSSNDSFLDNGIIDSTGILELVSFVEETFNIRVEDEEMIPENLDSIDNLTKFIISKRVNT